MGRILKIAAAQLGPVHLTSKREETVQRMITLLESAPAQGVQILLFPEIAFVTFFPRHLIQDQKELDFFFEHDADLPNSPNTKLLFEKAKELGVDISVGYAERATNGAGSTPRYIIPRKKAKPSPSTEKSISPAPKTHSRTQTPSTSLKNGISIPATSDSMPSEHQKKKSRTAKATPS